MDKSNILLRNISVFYMAESANLPAVMAYAKKKAKNTLLTSNKEIIKVAMDRDCNRKFLRSLPPATYRNLITLLRAIPECENGGQDIFAEYQKHAREFRTNIDWKKTTSETERERLAMKNVLTFVNKHEGRFPNRGEVCEWDLYYFWRAMDEAEAVNTYKDVWRIDEKLSFPGDVEYLASTVSECGIENGDPDTPEDLLNDLTHMIREVMAWHNIPFSDFGRQAIGKKDVRKIAQLLYTRYQITAKLGEKLKGADDKRREELRAEAIHAVCDLVTPLAAVYKISAMYAAARDIANDSLDEISELKVKLEEEKAKNARKEIKEKAKQKEGENAQLAKETQKRLNKAQSDNEKLLLRVKELEAENAFLNQLLQNESAPEDEGADEVVEENAPYPKNTVLFGGHPSWQRRFSVVHPEVKIMSGTDAGFPENTLSARTPLVLLNSRHMAHKCFYKIRRLQQRMGFEVRYLK